MTDTTTLEAASADERPRRSGSLSALKLAELQGLASSMGITGTAKMRKSDLVAAITSRQNGESGPASSSSRPARRESGAERAAQARSTTEGRSDDAEPETGPRQRREERPDRSRSDREDGGRRDRDQRDPEQRDRRDERGRQEEGQDGRDKGRAREDRQGDQDRDDRRDRGNQGGQQQGNQTKGGGNGPHDDDGTSRSGRRRRNRNRNRDKRRGQGQGGGDLDAEPQISEDDVLVPVAGILDVLESYAFIRTSGYLPGANDVYVPLAVVKKHGLRKGDAVTGAIKATHDGEDAPQQSVGGRGSRQKFNPSPGSTPSTG